MTTDDIGRKLDEISGKIDTFGARVDERFSDLSATVSEGQTVMAASLQHINLRFDAVDTRLAVVESKLSNGGNGSPVSYKEHHP